MTLIALALGGADAHAAPYEISFEPESPVAGEQVSFHAERDKPGRGMPQSFSWDFGDGATATGSDPTHAYAAAGVFVVTLSTIDSHGKASLQDISTIDVRPASPLPSNAAPTAAFNLAPASPLAGEQVSFAGQASDPDGDAVTLSWTFGDGGTATGSAPSHTYARSGIYTVVLTARDEHGADSATFRTLRVRPPRETSPPPVGSEPPGGPVAPLPPTRSRLVMMSPFPVVRIAGQVLPHGALLRVLSVRAPRGAELRLRCRGRTCPVRSLARTSARRTVRFHRFERRLAAGTTLELFVRKEDTIGKYTRFSIRAGKAPARLDACLVPGRARPVRCP